MADSIRLLQVVESLDVGAVENWLVRIFARATTTHPQYHWTFYCALGRPGRLDEQVRALGGEIIYSPFELKDKKNFISHLRKTISRGKFHILHCHHDFVSAVYLIASLGLPLDQRIVHVHNTDEGIPTGSVVKRKALKEPMRQVCLRMADKIVGISQQALSQFTRNNGSQPEKHKVLYYGIETRRFREQIVSRLEFRRSLGLPVDAKVLLFIGRMVPLKNPSFVIDVLKEIRKADPSVTAVFSGAGELSASVEEKAREFGIDEAVKVLGWRDDGPSLMLLSDLLLFPRLEEPKEGLGLVLVEAQAAGLPILASPSITDDVQVVKELFEFVPLASGPKAWAEAATQMLASTYPAHEVCLNRIENSPFSLDAGVTNLVSLYES